MKRILTILALMASVAGCTSRPKPIAPRSTEPGYAEGFVDGYLSAHPDQPYAQDLRLYRPYTPYRRTSYRQGWDAGRQTGRNDEQQRD